MPDNKSALSPASGPEGPRTLSEGPAISPVPAVGDQKALHAPDGRFLPGVRQPGAKPWQPGQSGNPAGTSKAQRLTRKLLEALDKNDGEMVDALIRVALKEALKGNYQFWQHIFDRCDGSIAQRLAGHDGGPLQAGTPIGQAELTLIMTDPRAMDAARTLGNLLFPDEPSPSLTAPAVPPDDAQESGHAE
jgi:hypothetical protein